MAQHAHDAPDDPVIVLVEDDEPAGSFDEWLALVVADGPSESDAGAAEILREFRDRGES